MCVSSNCNMVFPCKICNININDKNSAVQRDICQFWIHIKWNKLNQIDYKYLQGPNDPWYCMSWCDEIFPYETLTNKKFLLLANTHSAGDCFVNNSDPHISKSSSLSLKASSNLSLLFNQFNNFSQSKKTTLKTL